jgi:hypothetical protein
MGLLNAFEPSLQPRRFFTGYKKLFSPPKSSGHFEAFHNHHVLPVAILHVDPQAPGFFPMTMKP